MGSFKLISIMENSKKKSSNVPSDQSRALAGIKLHSKNFVEKCSQSIIILSLSPNRKVEISGDDNSVKEIGSNMELVQQLESLLLSSFAKGVSKFSNLQELLLASQSEMSEEQGLYMCKLPRTKYKIFSEKKQFITTVRSSLAAVMEIEGYGRGKKNAGEGKGDWCLSCLVEPGL